jgi:hypothetical protein
MYANASSHKKSTAALIRKSSLSIIVLAMSLGCADAGEESGPASGDSDQVASSTQPVNGTASITNCTDARKQKLEKAVAYAYNRVTEGQYPLAECLNRSFVYDPNGKIGVNGWTIVPLLTLNTVTHINCADLTNGNANAGVGVDGEWLNFDNASLDVFDTTYTAGVILHEILHNRGFSHGSNDPSDPYYMNCAPVQEQFCFSDYVGYPAVEPGYILMWDGKVVGRESAWTRDQAVANCTWNKNTYPSKKVECWFQNKRLGYELYVGGGAIANRTTLEPGYSLATATSACNTAVKSRPGTRVECLFDGQRIGYELYYGNSRVGQEPTWSRASAMANCEWNRTTYPSKKVQCFYNGKGIGYELLWDGKRAPGGYQPTWSNASAVSNCTWNKANPPAAGTVVDCLFDGVPIR